MRGRREERIERVADGLAALALAGATAVSLFELLDGRLFLEGRAAMSAVAAVAAYVLGVRLLRAVEAEPPRFELRTFSPPELAFEELDELLLTDQVELVLTDADRLRSEPQSFDELVLDDILAKLGPQSRVVRLFDPAAMPTAGQLNARIERHLQAQAEPVASQDAAEALYQALSELRQSLR